MLNLLDLPTDILLLIFGEFERAPLTQSDGLYIASFQPKWESLPTLQACRLTCRSLNELVSGMLCPRLRGHLDKQTMERIENLSRNPLISQGVRVVELNLAFRPKSLATDLHQYCDFVTDKIDRLIGSCSYHTEFGDYEDGDQSDKAIRHRELLAASDKLYLVRESWRQCVNPGTRPNRTADTSYQQLLSDCFATYGLKQQEAEEIVFDGSFVGTIASALSRFLCLDLLSFVDSTDAHSHDPPLVASDKAVLKDEMLMPRDWLSIENAQIASELLPAGILVELPMACARLGTPLRGIDIGCFPLKSSFISLFPPGKDLEPDLEAAFRSLKVFQFGRNGMNCTPYRTEGIPSKDCTIIDEYLKAACSAPGLALLYLSMIPLRVCNRGPDAADLYYQADGILQMLRSSRLTHIEVMDVEMSSSVLESVIEKLPQFVANKIRLCSIDLHEGGYATTIDLLRSIKDDAKDCSIDLSTLSGGEFGPAEGFHDDGFMLFLDGEEAEEAWNNLENHMNPPLLKRVKAYIHGEGEVNPLLA